MLNGDYLKPNSMELKTSKVACLLDELNGTPINDSHWRGMHPHVYNICTNELYDKLLAELVDKLQTLDVSKYSLEMQIWWRDYQTADKERSEREAQDAENNQQKETALAKLTDSEKKLLGFA